jgi:hypothetical protein
MLYVSIIKRLRRGEAIDNRSRRQKRERASYLEVRLHVIRAAYTIAMIGPSGSG